MARNETVVLPKDGDTMPHLSENVYDRVTSLELRQKELLDALEEKIDLRIAEFEGVINGTEILEPETFMAQVLPEDERAIGGPYIPLSGEKPALIQSCIASFIVFPAILSGWKISARPWRKFRFPCPFTIIA